MEPITFRVGVTMKRKRKMSSGRSGITLVEMLVVIAIIGILAAILIPVIGGATRRAQVTQVQSEIRLMEDALTRFRAKYGMNPPSRLCLHENPHDGLAYGADHPGVSPDLNIILKRIDQLTIRVLKRLWPKFSAGNPGRARLNYYDYDANGVQTPFVQLTGSECLVFFLGGMPMPLVSMPGTDGSLGTADDLETLMALVAPGTSFELVTNRGVEGFSKDPRIPFARSFASNDPNLGMSFNADQRDAPLFEFDVSRLSDVDGDGFWEYYDPTQTPVAPGDFAPASSAHPYVYFSSNEGQMYNALTVRSPSGPQPIATFDNAWNIQGGQIVGIAFPLSRNMASWAEPDQVQWWNDMTYQIISPGIDGLIGTGMMNFGVAVFNPANPNYDLDAALTPEMHDNITNFTSGTLQDEGQ